jgi:predicted MFS family arabinose efflux permease
VAIGVFGLAGSLGMICLTALGGYLFDRYSGGSPFLMMAVVNALAFIALCTIGQSPGRPGGERGAERAAATGQ